MAQRKHVIDMTLTKIISTKKKLIKGDIVEIIVFRRPDDDDETYIGVVLNDEIFLNKSDGRLDFKTIFPVDEANQNYWIDINLNDENKNLHSSSIKYISPEEYEENNIDITDAWFSDEKWKNGITTQ